jgi:sarcosine oxidase
MKNVHKREVATMRTYDAIVLGCGAVGSAALGHLARRGLRVLALERFTPPHDRGSSHGRTRMIRQAYFEHPDYVPLVLRAHEQWLALESAVGRTLYRETGLLEIGSPSNTVVAGVLASARQHHLAVEDLSADDVERRFPGFAVPDGMRGVFERHAGLLHVEDCVRAQIEQALLAGAQVHSEETVLSWRLEGANVVVDTDRGRYESPRLAITAGAWAGQLLADVKVPLVVRRKPQYWFAPRGEAYRADAGTPAFLYETSAGVFYGFPVVGSEGVKCAEHSGGAVVADPLTLSRDVDPIDLARVTDFIAACLPQLTTTLNDHAPCMYTMSADGNFLLDVHPRYPQVSFVAGLSGHGFKFAPVLGEALADLATTGRSDLPVEFLMVKRLTRESMC